MDQQHHLPESTEPVTDEEVHALVHRFGERQTMAQGQPTVADVAEALQVAPVTVAKMLQELRESKDQDEIRQRLDNLEMENTELRERAGISSALHSPFTNANIRVPFLIAMITAIIIVQLVSMAFESLMHEWYQQFAAIAVLFWPLYFVSRWLIIRIRRR